eukprot:1217439-Alexandrium_andersonii.AAC.1
MLLEQEATTIIVVRWRAGSRINSFARSSHSASAVHAQCVRVCVVSSSRGGSPGSGQGPRFIGAILLW